MYQLTSSIFVGSPCNVQERVGAALKRLSLVMTAPNSANRRRKEQSCSILTAVATTVVTFVLLVVVLSTRGWVVLSFQSSARHPADSNQTVDVVLWNVGLLKACETVNGDVTGCVDTESLIGFSRGHDGGDRSGSSSATNAGPDGHAVLDKSPRGGLQYPDVLYANCSHAEADGGLGSIASRVRAARASLGIPLALVATTLVVQYLTLGNGWPLERPVPLAQYIPWWLSSALLAPSALCVLVAFAVFADLYVHWFTCGRGSMCSEVCDTKSFHLDGAVCSCGLSYDFAVCVTLFFLLIVAGVSSLFVSRAVHFAAPPHSATVVAVPRVVWGITTGSPGGNDVDDDAVWESDTKATHTLLGK